MAAELLAPSTSKIVNELLEGNTISYIAPWADDVRHTSMPWTAPFHFINTPDWECGFNPATNVGCQENGCLYTALHNYTELMLDTSQSKTMRFNATKFVVHFMGDLHQPLHVAFASDDGGNAFTGTFLGQSVNLHHVWDDSILYQIQQVSYENDRTLFQNALVEKAKATYKRPAKETYDSTSYLSRIASYASETAAAACKYAYVDSNGNDIKSGFDLGEAYFNVTRPVVETQLVLAAQRLAMEFDRYFQ